MFKARSVPPVPAKLQGAVRDLRGLVKVIVKVRTPGHVPAAATLRSRIDETMFTAELDAGRLQELAADPDVVTVSVSSPILPAAR